MIKLQQNYKLVAKSFLIVIFVFSVWFILSSEVLNWIDDLNTASINQLLSLLPMSFRVGEVAAPITAMSLSACILFIWFGLTYGKVHRFIALHLGLFTIAILIGASISVAVYFYLFEDIHILFPAPSYIFTAFHLSQENNNSEFFFACFIGFGITGIAYFTYFAKEFLSFGKELGKARFANALEIHKAGLFEKNGNHKGFVLAKTAHGKLYYNDFEPIVVVSGTGGGKSSSLVIPNMLELVHENIVVTDIKGNIYQKTHKLREAIGNKVYKLEPGSKSTHRYNPLGLARKSHLDEDLDSIFKTLIPDSSDNIWAEESRNIAKALALYEFLENKKIPTLQGIYQMLCNPKFFDAVTAMYGMVQEQRLRNMFGKLVGTNEKTRDGYLANARSYLSKFDSPNLAYATSDNDFTFDELCNSPTTIYLVIPASTATYGPICSVFFEQMIRLTTANSERREDKKNPYPINAIIDEFANLPKMPALASGVSFLRSYRIRVCVFVQQISQLKDVYGNNKKDSLMASPLKLAFKVGDLPDARYFSELAGKKTVKVKNDSTQQNMSMSVSNHKQLRAVISSDELMKLKDNHLLIYKTGFNVIKAKKNFWFKSREYKKISKS